MDRADLYDEWQRNKDRPAWVRNRREELHDHTDTSDPIPDGSLFEVRQWLSRYKATVTRQLNDDTDDTDPQDTDDVTDGDGNGDSTDADGENGETDTTDGTEGSA